MANSLGLDVFVSRIHANLSAASQRQSPSASPASVTCVGALGARSNNTAGVPATPSTTQRLWLVLEGMGSVLHADASTPG